MSWPLVELGRLGTFSKGRGLSKKDLVPNGVPCVRYGEIYTRHRHFVRRFHSFVPEALARRSVPLVRGDVLFAASGETLDEIGKSVAYLSSERACVGGDIIILRPRPELASSRFLGYALEASPAIHQKRGMGQGITIVHISANALSHLRIALPPLATQEAIANHLDAKTAAIDALATKKRALLEKLTERHASRIARAVTRGLDPAAPTKDSGVPWIGAVPAHWTVTELRRAWSVIDCQHRTPAYVDAGFPVVSTTEVKPGRLDLSKTTRFIDAHEFADMTAGGRRPRRGDIVYSRNASIGAAAYVDTDAPFAMGQDVVLIRSDQHDQLYLSQLLNSAVGMAQVELACVGATFKRINVGQIRRLTVCVPPIGEQRAIAAFVDRTEATHAALARALETQLDRLEEYRQAVITAETHP